MSSMYRGNIQRGNIQRGNAQRGNRVNNFLPHSRNMKNSNSQPPTPTYRGMNVVNVNNQEQDKLISIIKTHTTQINTSVSPRRHTHSPICSQKGLKGGIGKSEAKPNGIKDIIDASRFFSKSKKTEDSNFNTLPPSTQSLELSSQ